MTMLTCQRCGTQREGTDGFADTMLPGAKLGHCDKCGHRTVWRPTSPANAGAAVGERQAQRGMAGAENAEVPSGWAALADEEIRNLARGHEPFTSDALVAAVGMPPHFNAVGARMNAAARAGVIRKVGYTQSSRESGHARAIAVWEGKR